MKYDVVEYLGFALIILFRWGEVITLYPYECVLRYRFEMEAIFNCAIDSDLSYTNVNPEQHL